MTFFELIEVFFSIFFFGSGLVTRHTEEWNHEHNATAADGTIYGSLNEWRKLGTANFVLVVMGIWEILVYLLASRSQDNAHK